MLHLSVGSEWFNGTQSDHVAPARTRQSALQVALWIALMAIMVVGSVVMGGV
jgi:hypothetical protein